SDKRRIEVKAKAINLLAITALLATFLGVSQGTAQAATCSVPSVVPFYPTIQSAVNDPSCTTINVAPGVYPENVTITRSVILNGAQAGVNPVTTLRGAESFVTGTGTPPPTFTIQAANVTIDGFSVTNPNQSTGILVKTAGDNAIIRN